MVALVVYLVLVAACSFTAGFMWNAEQSGFVVGVNMLAAVVMAGLVVSEVRKLLRRYDKQNDD